MPRLRKTVKKKTAAPATALTNGGVTLSSCQEKAWGALQGRDNIFLTGAAGTGKSFLLRKFLEGKPSALFPVVASTGVAAILVGGRTFHSFFGLGILEGGAERAARKAHANKKVLTRLRCAHGIVIDEVSMLAGEALRAAEIVARHARGNNAPWGGLQIIAVGDFAQLPPVNAADTSKDWAFRSDVWAKTLFLPALLRTCVRTKEEEFLRVLNFIREGIVNEEVTNFLDTKVTPASLSFSGTRLFPHRATAEMYNRRKLDELPDVVTVCDTVYSGQERYVDQLRKNCPVPETLHLKRNALVMLRKNDAAMRYVNGSLGTLKRIDADCLVIKLFTGETVEIEKSVFGALDGNGNEVAFAENFPINLAWASTIHKSQGATLDAIFVDLSRLWEPGQAYVALSRVRSATGVFVEKWHPRSIIAEPQVMDFYREMDRA